jgi:hypothetical protein
MPIMVDIFGGNKNLIREYLSLLLTDNPKISEDEIINSALSAQK